MMRLKLLVGNKIGLSNPISTCFVSLQLVLSHTPLLGEWVPLTLSASPLLSVAPIVDFYFLDFLIDILFSNFISENIFN